MQTLPNERLERAILREGHTVGHAFVQRMMDVQATPMEGTVVLASMLVQVCAQCHQGDLDAAQEMLAMITQVAQEGLGPLCEYVQALMLAEEASVAETADLAVLERLVRSSMWREYREQVLLPAYGRVSQALDVAQSDHRYLQGLKEGLRLAMVEPYRLLALPSPLEASPSMTRRAQDRASTAPDAAPEDAPVLAPRPSYLA